MANVRSADYDAETDRERPDPAPEAKIEEPDVLLPNEARQGVTHHNVRTVLAVSLSGAVLCLAIAYIVFFA